MKALPLLRRWWSAPFVRAAVWGTLGLAAFAGGILLAYELALAKVPQHRATLERLVRAQTGLDVRFNELNLRWGWYGPEAVFHNVELGEPGRSNVLVRAPQLTVGFDAWRSVQSGQLQAGRITLLAPDINLERPAKAASRAGSTTKSETMRDRLRLLERWRGGRIDVEGGTLRLPGQGGSSDVLSLQIRRASLRRSDARWSASALVFLPDRLGHTARVAAQLEGDPARFKTLSGTVRFDGLRLAFAGWREIFSERSAFAQRLPAAGEGDVSFRVSFDRGRIEKADGRVHAQNVSLSEQSFSPGMLNLARLRGDWRLVRRQGGWQFRAEELDLGSDRNADTLPHLALQIAPEAREIRGELGTMPLDSLAALASWLAPEVDLSAVDLKGLAGGLEFDWDAKRLEGERLAAHTRIENFSFAPPSRSFTLEGLNATLSASESGLDIELKADRARLVMARAPEQALDALEIASELRLSRGESGWRLNTPLLTLDRDETELILSGSLTSQPAPAAPLLEMRGTLVRAPVPLLKDLLRDETIPNFWPAVSQLTAGRIERAQFELQAALESEDEEDAQKATRVFNGSLTLRDGQLTAGGLWPEVEELDAQLDWTGESMKARVDRARAGSMHIRRGSLAFEKGALKRATLAASWSDIPLTLRVSERAQRDGPALWVQAHGVIDAQRLLTLAGIESLPEVTGETSWTGELLYAPARERRPARWQLDADASLIGVDSLLPQPLAKAAVTAVPLHITASGSELQAKLRVSLSDRLRSQVALIRKAPDAGWQMERGAVNFGGETPTIPTEPLIALQGRIDSRIVAHLKDSWKDPRVVVTGLP